MKEKQIKPIKIPLELAPASVAYRITLSPHEWTWTQAEQEAMAQAIVEMQAVKGCPFCGCHPVLLVLQDVYFYKCYGCLAEGPRTNTELAAKRLWNGARRVNEV